MDRVVRAELCSKNDAGRGESPRGGTRVLHRGGGGRGELWTECKKESKCTPELKMKKCSLDKE